MLTREFPEKAERGDKFRGHYDSFCKWLVQRGARDIQIPLLNLNSWPDGE